MRTLLRIDASMRVSGSHTRLLADYYQLNWSQRYPNGRVVRRDLASESVPHLSSEVAQAFYDKSGKPDSKLILSNELVNEMILADDILISSPLYNLSLPSTLKAYLDHVVRPGKSFQIVDGSYIGLVNINNATIITARGSLSSPFINDDFQTEYLCALMKMIGVKDVRSISLEGASLPKLKRQIYIHRAKARIDSLFSEEGIVVPKLAG